MAVKRRRTPRGPSLIERAVAAKVDREIREAIAVEVRSTFTSAQIHALTGSDSGEMVNKAGRMFFVVLGAAVADGLDPSLPEIRILRGAANAVYDQAGEEVITEASRASIVSGLLACERLLAELDFDSVTESAFELHCLLERGAVRWSDFEPLIEAVSA
ncbi:hypothetical protein H4CHR_04411 [Variovorax sp. PBS-H4]|uniref:hypothetical protein n=1 Tax=Variovorax sp. PBS-H4 TaxID=434008 RepID=UPI001318C0F8|nr:hypothetical protein [Variovorax sp. PBS-H4]VTU38382.1 hypothetical protein H4CHR_04411 [Variovorax sp. PBS-H4]